MVEKPSLRPWGSGGRAFSWRCRCGYLVVYVARMRPHNQPERRQRTVARIYPPSLKIYKPLALQRIRHSLFAAKHAKNVRGREEVCDRAHCAEPMNH